jgi:hypothetical protein
MTEKRAYKKKGTAEPSAPLKSPRPAAGTEAKPSRRRRRLGLTPEGVDRQFWPLWRAHVLAGIGMITGYSLGLPMMSDTHRKDS